MKRNSFKINYALLLIFLLSLTAKTYGQSPYITPSRSSISFGYGSGSYTIDVSSNVSWSVSPNDSWIIAAGSGSGNGNFVLSWVANTSTNSRSGSVTISGGGTSATISVTQAGAPPPPNITASPSSISFGYGSGSTTIEVSSTVDFSISSNDTWIHATGSGYGFFDFNLSCDANTSTSSRSGSITISGGGVSATVTVTQAGAPPYITPNPSSISFGYGSGSYTIDVSSNVSWSVSPNDSWISASGSGNGWEEAGVSCQANTSANARTGSVTISGGGTSATVTVTQAGTPPSPYITASPLSISVVYGSGSTDINIFSNVSWSISSNNGWISAAGSGSGNGSFNLNYDANTSSSSRTGSVTISGGSISATVTVTQAGTPPPPYITASPLSISVVYGSGSTDINIFSNVSWSISSNNGWISAAGSGSGNGSFNLNYDANTSSSSRTGSVTINGGGASATVTVTQAGASPQYTLTVSSSGGGSVTKNPNQTTYVSGTNVSLTPVAATGYTFSSWSGDASGSTNPLTVTMNGNKNITANFTLIQYTLTVNATNGTVAKNPNQSTYSYGANVTLTATPNAGYTFTNWTESGTVVFTSANYSFTVSASRNLVANFTSTGSSTNFLDETGKTVSVYGDAQISTAQSEFGGASGMFNGSNDSLSVSDNADWLLDAGNGSPFTIDFWMRLTSDGNTNQFLLSQANVPYSSYWDFYYTGSTSNKIIFRASGNLNIQCTPSFSTGIWYHIALERVNNTNAATGWRIFINGVSKTLTLGDGNWSDYIVDVSGSLIIGNSIGYNTGLKGYMDELRISKGIARWTSNFTPPASPYSVDSYTKLLMHMDGVSTPTYSISTTSNPSNGGTITPGDTTVNYGDSLRFSIKPSTGYSIKNIITDGGTLLPADTSYTFKNIASPHMITVIFAKNTNGLLRYYYVKDHLGSVRVTVDEAGEIKSYDDYDPWGMRLAGRSGNFGDANDKYKFTGKERDKETASTTVPDGLDYFGARYYDSRIGRFNSVDRLIDKYPSLSSYQYGGNNPILFIDVNGDSAWAITNQWTNETFKNYQTFAANYISTYKDKKIDCADLALTALVEYASQNGLPIDLRYYRDGSWQSFNAASDEFSSKDEYLSTVTNKLGALNIIDNTKPIALENAGAGDLIMSKLSEQMGHTRIIYDNIYDKRTNNSWIAFYSGTYPPDFVKKQEGSFNKLINIYGNSPRRWRFDLWH